MSYSSKVYKLDISKTETQPCTNRYIQVPVTHLISLKWENIPKHTYPSLSLNGFKQKSSYSIAIFCTQEQKNAIINTLSYTVLKQFRWITKDCMKYVMIYRNKISYLNFGYSTTRTWTNNFNINFSELLPLKIFSRPTASPKSTLRWPGNNGPKPRVASLSQLMEMTANVRPWKQPQHETIIACIWFTWVKRLKI